MSIYWKKSNDSLLGGFYDYEIQGSKEISAEKWQELINNQNNGFMIIDDGFGNPINVEQGFLKNNKQIISTNIKQLRKNLDNTDYKIIKCYEASLLNEPMPYNIQELTIQRKQWREEINSLEQQLEQLK